MPHCKQLILLIVFSGLFFCCTAQEGNKYVYQDSSVQATDSVTAHTAETQTDNNNYSSSTVNTRVLADSVLRFNGIALSSDSIDVLKNDKDFAYAKNLDSLLQAIKEKDKKANTEQKDISRSDWLERLLASPKTTIVLWFLAGLFIAFILYKLFFVEGSFFKGRTARSNVNELDAAEAINTASDYQKLITQAIQNKEYRLAVRYLYLQTLQLLVEKKMIQPEIEKTNYQYINELSNTMYKDSFKLLTLNYEYVWYGTFDLKEETFDALKNSFDQFNNRLQKN